MSNSRSNVEGAFDRVAAALNIDPPAEVLPLGRASFKRRVNNDEYAPALKPQDLVPQETIPVTRKGPDMPMSHEWSDWPLDRLTAFLISKMPYGTYMEIMEQVVEINKKTDSISKAFHQWAVEKLNE